MSAQPEATELWIGTVEVRSVDGASGILGDTRGAFVNIVTWASDAEEFRRKADVVIGGLGGLFVSEVLTPEPVAVRRAGTGEFGKGIEDMLARAERNPNAIIYGTFHTYEKDDA